MLSGSVWAHVSQPDNVYRVHFVKWLQHLVAVDAARSCLCHDFKNSRHQASRRVHVAARSKEVCHDSDDNILASALALACSKISTMQRCPSLLAAVRGLDSLLLVGVLVENELPIVSRRRVYNPTPV